MNLWVKRAGLLFAAALFLMSCEDDSFLLGFKNQNKKFNVRYQEFTLPSSVVLIDSLITDNYPIFGNTYRLLIGQYMDPQFGTVKASAYTQLQPIDLSAIDKDKIKDPTLTFTYDSIMLQLRLDYYSYGSEGEGVQSFTIHEITEDSLSFFDRYYYNTTFGYDPTPLAEASLDVDYDDLLRAKDTLLFNVRLDDAFGQKVFMHSKTKTVAEDSAFAKSKIFKYLVKGLAFVPSNGDMVLGFNPSSAFCQVVLHYHTNKEDSLTRVLSMFPGSAHSFSNITTARIGDLSAITQPYERLEIPTGYLQNGSPVITKIDLSGYYDFITGSADGINDSLKQIVINRAEILMDVETPPTGMPPPTSLYMRVMDSNDEFLYEVVDEDSVFATKFYSTNDFRYFYPVGDNIFSRTAIELTYNKSKKQYIGFATLFIQSLFDRKEVNRKASVPLEKLLYLGMVPLSPMAGKTLSRAVIKPNSIKLKIQYTTPVISNKN